MFDHILDSSKSSGASSHYLNRQKMGSKSHWIHKTTLESQPSTNSSGSKQHRRSRASTIVDILPEPSFKLLEWDSHLNMQQIVTNRTKLETPNSEESIEAYAKACREKFDQKLAKGKFNHDKPVLSKKSARSQPIYTKPYSSDSYSDIQNIQRSNEDRIKRKQSDVFTSATESDGFLSPNSISIGVAANSTSNTTTHQYDTKISVGLQTSNTLERMPMIQLKKPDENVKENEVTSEDQPTRRVNKLTVNKQLQVRPEAMAYIIMFKEEHKMDEKINSETKGQERSNRVDSANGNNNNEDNRYPNALKRSSKKPNTGEPIADFSGRTNSNSSSIASLDNLTLQECLQTRRPDFYANAEQRRKCLNDLHNLR